MPTSIFQQYSEYLSIPVGPCKTFSPFHTAITSFFATDNFKSWCFTNRQDANQVSLTEEIYKPKNTSEKNRLFLIRKACQLQGHTLLHLLSHSSSWRTTHLHDFVPHALNFLPYNRGPNNGWQDSSFRIRKTRLEEQSSCTGFSWQHSLLKAQGNQRDG